MELQFIVVKCGRTARVTPVYMTPDGQCRDLHGIATIASMQNGVAFSSGLARELAGHVRCVLDTLAAEGYMAEISDENLKFVYRWLYNTPLSTELYA